MVGLDAHSLIEYIAAEYGVDFSDFDADRYIQSEGCNLFQIIIDRIYGREIKTSTFTGEHLFNVIVARKWFPPDN